MTDSLIQVGNGAPTKGACDLPFPLPDLRAAANEYAGMAGVGRGPGAVVTPEAVLALVEAVEAMDEWRNAPNVRTMRRGRKRTEKAFEAFGLGMLA